MSKSATDIMDEIRNLEYIDNDIIESYQYYSELIHIQELRNIRKLKQREIEILEESLQLSKNHAQSVIELNQRQIEATENQTQVYQDAAEKSIQAFDGMRNLEVTHTHRDE